MANNGALHVSVLVARKSEQEIRWKPAGVALHLFIQTLDRNAVQLRQVGIQYDLLAPQHGDL
jgi:hypothetical protein